MATVLPSLCLVGVGWWFGLVVFGDRVGLWCELLVFGVGVKDGVRVWRMSY